jgi:hypothetical protein
MYAEAAATQREGGTLRVGGARGAGLTPPR